MKQDSFWLAAIFKVLQFCFFLFLFFSCGFWCFACIGGAQWCTDDIPVFFVSLPSLLSPATWTDSMLIPVVCFALLPFVLNATVCLRTPFICSTSLG